MFKPGEIIKPKKAPEVILKCIGPLESFYWGKSSSIQTESFVLTNEFPACHYLVIVRPIKNFHFPGINYYLTHMITHSGRYNNMKIEHSHYSDSKLDLKDNSYISRDVFLILSGDIEGNEILGMFNLEKLYEDFQNY